MQTYVPLIQRFVSSAFLFHATVAEQLGLHASDLKALQLLGAEPLSPGEIGQKTGSNRRATWRGSVAARIAAGSPSGPFQQSFGRSHAYTRRTIGACRNCWQNTVQRNFARSRIT